VFSICALPVWLLAEWLYWLRHLTPLVPPSSLALDPDVQPAAAQAAAAVTDDATGIQLSPADILQEWLSAVGAGLPAVTSAAMGSVQEVQVEQWCLVWGRVQLRRVRLVAQTALAARLAAQTQPGDQGGAGNNTGTSAASRLPVLVHNMPGGWGELWLAEENMFQQCMQQEVAAADSQGSTNPPA
jgi:hypothetical protein